MDPKTKEILTEALDQLRRVYVTEESRELEALRLSMANQGILHSEANIREIRRTKSEALVKFVSNAWDKTKVILKATGYEIERQSEDEISGTINVSLGNVLTSRTRQSASSDEHGASIESMHIKAAGELAMARIRTDIRLFCEAGLKAKKPHAGAHASDIEETDGLFSGQTFREWTLNEKLGKGGNGVVWLARNSENQQVAIKFLHSNLFGKLREERFRDEINFLTREGHREGILPIVASYLPEVSTISDRPWFATPKGMCLENLPLSGVESLPKVVEHVQFIAQTLAKLHAEKIFHRDLKPENLFIFEGRPVLGDFGLVDYADKDAKTHTSEVLGSRNFAAPEMENNARNASGGPADVFSLAKTLWVLAAQGRRNPPGGQIQMDDHLVNLRNSCGHPRSDILDRLIERSTESDTTKRPTMQEFANELLAWLNPPTSTESGLKLAPIIREYQSAFEVADRDRRRKGSLIDASRVILNSFEPYLVQLANLVGNATNWKAEIGYASHLERHQFVELYGAPKCVWRDAREVRVTMGEAWAVYLQSFVQVEAISDDRIRIVTGHLTNVTAHGGHFFRGANEFGMQTAIGPQGSAQLENEVQSISSTFLDGLGPALGDFGERLRELQNRG